MESKKVECKCEFLAYQIEQHCSMIFCYKGQLNDSQIVKENEELAPNVKRVLDDLKNKCQLSMGGLRGPRRGFRLDFNPPIYDFYSLVDMQKQAN